MRPLQGQLKSTVSQRLLRDIVRRRGEEAGGELQHRMQMKPRKAGLMEASALGNATPNTQDGMGGGSGRTLIILTPRDLFGSAKAVGRKEASGGCRFGLCSAWRVRWNRNFACVAPIDEYILSNRRSE